MFLEFIASEFSSAFRRGMLYNAALIGLVSLAITIGFARLGLLNATDLQGPILDQIVLVVATSMAATVIYYAPIMVVGSILKYYEPFRLRYGLFFDGWWIYCLQATETPTYGGVEASPLYFVGHFRLSRNDLGDYRVSDGAAYMVDTDEDGNPSKVDPSPFTVWSSRFFESYYNLDSSRRYMFFNFYGNNAMLRSDRSPIGKSHQGIISLHKHRTGLDDPILGRSVWRGYYDDYAGFRDHGPFYAEDVGGIKNAKTALQFLQNNCESLVSRVREQVAARPADL